MSSHANTGVTEYSTPTDREVVIARAFAAPRPLVFEAWTNPKYIPQWMLGPPGWTMPVCELDLRPGGAWRYVWRQADGNEMEMTGEVREVDPPARVVTTERWGADWPETVNSMVLVEEDGVTRVTLTITYPSKEAREAALQTGMKEGMEQSFGRLESLVQTMAASADRR
jgi:uncharacterized protein YndB with AHSA1/START domain